MAYEMPNFVVGVLPADIDMSAQPNPEQLDPTYQYTGVSVYTALSTEGTGVGGAAIIPPVSTSSPIIGVLQNNPQQGEAGQVTCEGITKALAGGALSIGDLVKCLPNGSFAKATAGSYAVGVAMELAASGDITTILLQRNGIQA